MLHCGCAQAGLARAHLAATLTQMTMMQLTMMQPTLRPRRGTLTCGGRWSPCCDSSAAAPECGTCGSRTCTTAPPWCVPSYPSPNPRSWP